MYKGKKISVIIAAAGMGTRLGSKIPKQFLNIDGEPMVVKTIRAFCACEEIDEIVIVTSSPYDDFCREAFPQAKVVLGGKERQDSVYAALKETGEDMDYVLVHDGARPFVRKETILSLIKETLANGAAICTVRVKDTIREKDHTLDRSKLYAVQTPQGFRREILLTAFEQAMEDGVYGTDEASLVERLGITVALAEGDYGNIKITTREDMPVERRVGTGYDVHRLTEGRKLILGGVEIPYEKGLLGHSDADVLVHAAMDAILGAAALGDIGKLFPDSDEKYKGISSIKLLEIVGEKIKKEGFSMGNLDVTLIAQKPKISPYIEEMVNNIAKALGIESGQVNVKGTTTEGLGFTGTGEGIAAQAICMLNR